MTPDPTTLSSITAYPIAAILCALCGAVGHLYLRVTRLEKDFRDFAIKETEERTKILDRTTRVLERLSPAEGKIYICGPEATERMQEGR